MKPMLISEKPAESRAGDVLLVPIAAVAFWTLAYQLVLILRWPAKTITWCFLAIAVAGFYVLGRLWKKRTQFQVEHIVFTRPTSFCWFWAPPTQRRFCSCAGRIKMM